MLDVLGPDRTGRKANHVEAQDLFQQRNLALRCGMSSTGRNGTQHGR